MVQIEEFLCRGFSRLGFRHGRIYHFSLPLHWAGRREGRGSGWEGGDLFRPLGGVITWHRAVECLVSVSDCLIYNLPLLSSSKYDDIVVSCCDKQHLYGLNLL